MARPRGRSMAATAVCCAGVLLLSAAASVTSGFAPPAPSAAACRRTAASASCPPPLSTPRLAIRSAALRASPDDNDAEGKGKRAALRRLLSRVPAGRRLRRRAAPAALAFLTAASLTLRPGALDLDALDLSLSVGVPAAHARTPTQALQDIQGVSREESDVPLEAARAKRDRRRAEEAMEYKKECERIEIESGKGARKKFEAEREVQREAERETKAVKRVELIDSLLKRGICPFVDPEGVRQMTLHDEDIDLAFVDGTEQSYDRIEVLSGKGDKVLKKYENARYIVKCQADDLRLHGKDPSSYFAERKESTEAIYALPEYQQKKMADNYRSIIAEHGSLNPVTEGEREANEAAEREAKSAAESSEAEVKSSAEKENAEKKAKQEEAKRQRDEERAAAKAEKEAAKAAKKAEKEATKAAKTAEKEANKAAKSAAKVAAAAATAVATHAAADAEVAATSGMEMMATAGQEAVTPSHLVDAEAADAEGEEVKAAAVAATPAPSSSSPLSAVSKVPIVPVVAGVGVIGGGGYAFKVKKDRAAAEEEERQKQFRLIMGDGATDDDEDEADVDDDEEDEADDSGPIAPEDSGDDETADDLSGEITGTSDSAANLEASTSGSDFPSMMPPKGGAGKPKPAPAAKAAPAAEAPKKKVKKKRGGIASIFNKKGGSGRETDLFALVAPSAKYSSFSSSVAKLLTFGAPGRFPDVQSLSGGMPMDTYDMEAARAILAGEKSAAAIPDQDAAEQFATVVNCMIVDIIDLASSTLGEKDKGQEKLTAEAINIVMDFMDHAAGLFEPFLVEVSRGLFSSIFFPSCIGFFSFLRL
uniref:Uncharacterized protein n=1 Tax=Odontella aurita TaxID=265563 RepID=A0A7S4JJB8_9STRA|mmetsp:Transcript_4735/g.13346  ORF Transcript_4735/g.13346 Transcript_4735/m.13346 type:complete len:820 (+) Transcript_4735:143-2602(+)